MFELIEQLPHGFDRRRHLGVQAQLGIVGETDQLGLFLAQFQDLFEDRAVV